MIQTKGGQQVDPDFPSSFHEFFRKQIIQIFMIFFQLCLIDEYKNLIKNEL